MEKEIKINGYRCKFLDNTESPDCEFLCIPIVHDVKYVKSWATISFTPEEKETFGKRIHILDSRMMPSPVPSKALSIFVFTYQEDDDIEFIKRNAQFFFREGKSPEVEPSDDTAEFAIIKSVDKNTLEVVRLMYSFAGLSIKDAKQLVDLVRKGFYQKLPLNHLPADNKRFLLSQLRDNNVKFTLQ
jgi:hypothetical protein